MIKYSFKVEVPFLDKTNNLKEIKKDTIIQVTEERLKQLNAAEVGRVISAVYEEDGEKTTRTSKTKNNKDEKVETLKEDETKEPIEDSKTEEKEESAEQNQEEAKEVEEITDNK